MTFSFSLGAFPFGYRERWARGRLLCNFKKLFRIFRFAFRLSAFWSGCAGGVCSSYLSRTCLGCFVVGSSATVALETCRYEIVKLVASTSVMLDQVIGCGGLAFFAPVAPGFVFE